jgi:hypothetical protein
MHAAALSRNCLKDERIGRRERHRLGNPRTSESPYGGLADELHRCAELSNSMDISLSVDGANYPDPLLGIFNP